MSLVLSDLFLGYYRCENITYYHYYYIIIVMILSLPGPARLRLRADQLRAGVRLPGPGGGVQHAGHLQRHAHPAALPGQVIIADSAERVCSRA